MKKYYFTIVITILLLLLVIATIYNYHQNTVLESRINTILKYSCDITSEKTFKEDYYIQQQSHDTNLILLVFGVVLTLTGFFTYHNIVDKFDSKSSEFKKLLKKHKTEINGELADIILSSAKDVATLAFSMSDDYFKKGDKVNYLHYLLLGVEKHTEVSVWAIKKFANEDGVEEVLASIKEVALNRLKIVLRRIGPELEVIGSTLEKIEESIENIRKLDDREVGNLLSQIQAKLKKNK